jgi:putative peptide zinc metalloprotease protein
LHPFIILFLEKFIKSWCKMKVTPKSKMKLHPLDIRKEKKFYIIEDLSTGEFFEMPEVCIVAINKINDGLCLSEIEDELKLQFPAEEVNLLEFAEQLLELEMVEEVDGDKIQSLQRNQEKLGLTFVSSKLGKFFFSKTSKVAYFSLFLLNIMIFSLNPHLFPHFKDVFIFDFMFQNIIIWFFIGGILVLIHELGHIMAIRAHELPTKLEVGHRLFFIVLETDLSLGWKLTAKERIFVYFAGMCFDNVVLFIALIAQIFFPNAPELFTSILAFIALDVVIRLIYQCCVYMKTDLYYVLENLTGCHNLMENTKGIIFKRKEVTNIFAGEIRTIKIYSVFYFLGLALSFLLFVGYYIPQLAYTVKKVAPGLKSSIHSVEFLDSVIVIAQLVLVFGVLAYSWAKSFRRSY